MKLFTANKPFLLCSFVVLFMGSVMVGFGNEQKQKDKRRRREVESIRNMPGVSSYKYRMQKIDVVHVDDSIFTYNFSVAIIYYDCLAHIHIIVFYPITALETKAFRCRWSSPAEKRCLLGYFYQQRYFCCRRACLS